MMLAYLLYRLAAWRDRLTDAVFGRCVVGLDDMPGHPERLRPTGDPMVDAEFWDTAEALLDDPADPDLSEVNDRWGVDAVTVPAPVTFTVFGSPAGQGNLSRGGGGKLRHSNGTELEGWRTLVRGAAARATGYHALTLYGKRPMCVHCGTDRRKHGLFPDAVALDAIVAIARPPTVTRPYPTSRRHSDWDHYGRAISDALTGVMYPDDSQVMDGRVRTVYVGGPGCPLPEPGALITVKEIT